MITVQFKILPIAEQEKHLKAAAYEYIRCINALVSRINESSEMLKLSSANVQAVLPSTVRGETIRTAKSIIVKYMRGKCGPLPVIKKPMITWNNQSYKLSGGTLSFSLWIDGKCQRISVAAVITDYQRERLTNKLGALRVTQRNGKWIAQIAVEPVIAKPTGNGVMGVDIGLKNPAVAVTDTGKTAFFGNGHQNKYMKRQFRSKRTALGKAKKPEVIKKLNNKEQRWMKDQDHKVSRQVVNFAKDNGVSVIRLEQLQNIRSTARKSRKNEKNLHTWSFYRLAQFIAYKAAMLGIKVIFVNPAYTSQSCPKCGNRNHAKDRSYTCGCGFRSHRDKVGAMNIINAPVVSGNRKPA